VLSAAQLFFTCVGFGIAIWQLVRTASLLEKVRSRLIENDLLVALPELHKLEDELDDSVKGGDPSVVERMLVKYSRSSSRISALLQIESTAAEEPLVLLLAQAGNSAQKAKAELAQGSDRELAEVVKLAMGKVAKVSAEASGLIARLEKRVSA